MRFKDLDSSGRELLINIIGRIYVSKCNSTQDLEHFIDNVKCIYKDKKNIDVFVNFLTALYEDAKSMVSKKYDRIENLINEINKRLDSRQNTLGKNEAELYFLQIARNLCEILQSHELDFSESRFHITEKINKAEKLYYELYKTNASPKRLRNQFLDILQHERPIDSLFLEDLNDTDESNQELKINIMLCKLSRKINELFEKTKNIDGNKLNAYKKTRKKRL